MRWRSYILLCARSHDVCCRLLKGVLLFKLDFDSCPVPLVIVVQTIITIGTYVTHCDPSTRHRFLRISKRFIYRWEDDLDPSCGALNCKLRHSLVREGGKCDRDVVMCEKRFAKVEETHWIPRQMRCRILEKQSSKVKIRLQELRCKVQGFLESLVTIFTLDVEILSKICEKYFIYCSVA